jgi:hypothetical protein
MTHVWFLTLICAGTLMAQSHGYVLVAPGTAHADNDTLGLIHLAVGGEGMFKDGIGIGGEAGIIGRTDLGALGVASLNGYYHFNRERHLVPFVTGGYSSFFSFGGHVNLANVGGGVNYWYSDHFGIKLEFRDHFRTGTGSANYAEFRFGFDFK